MGMFDTIIDDSLHCPYCNSNLNINLQTKNIENNLDEYKVGEKYNRKIHVTGSLEINYSGSCHSNICTSSGNMLSYIQFKHPSLNGRFFSGKFLVNAGDDSFVIEKCLSIIPEQSISYKRFYELKQKFLRQLKHNQKHYSSLSKLQRKLGGCSVDFAMLSWIF
jgi:hypothetical protein